MSLPTARARAAQYRQLAVRAEHAAEQTPFPDMEAGFLDVAKRWRGLATELDLWTQAHSKRPVLPDQE
jgi:hypothetical protein